MTMQELVWLFEKARRRALVVGDADSGVVVGLDVEGRIFAYHWGEVLHRVNGDALLNESEAATYYNPGGDAFWPAPEGTRCGFLYGTGRWRVPPAITGARYRAVAHEGQSASVCAELDLLNAAGLGAPFLFRRDIAVAREDRVLRLTVTDSVRSLAARTVNANAFRIAPWTLAQFDTSPGMEVTFPDAPESSLRDFYGPSDAQRRREGGLWRVRTEGGVKFQIGIGPEVEAIALSIPARKLRVRRTARPISPAQPAYLDIADRSPETDPSDFQTRHSVYNDAGDFMEMEAAGPALFGLTPDAVAAHEVVTEFIF